MPNEDPIKDIKKLVDTGRLQLSQQAADAMTPPQAKIMVMLHEQNLMWENRFSEISRSFSKIFEKIDAASAHALEAKREAAETRVDIISVQGVLKSVEERQVVANGTALTLKAKVQMLEEKEREKDQEMLTNVIVSKAVHTATSNVWMIKKPSWQTLCAAGSIIAFIGVNGFVGAWHILTGIWQHIQP